MSDHEHDRDEEQESRRPRVVDKRISARGADAPPRPPAPEADETFRPPPRPEAEPASPQPPPAARPEESSGAPAGERVWTPEQEAEAQRIVEEIDRVPARDWVVNSAMNLVNVAGVKLDRGDLAGAQLAIDALSGIVNGTGARLGDAHEGLRQVLAQLQMAYAQVVQGPGGGTAGTPGTPG